MIAIQNSSRLCRPTRTPHAVHCSRVEPLAALAVDEEVTALRYKTVGVRHRVLFHVSSFHARLTRLLETLSNSIFEGFTFLFLHGTTTYTRDFTKKRVVYRETSGTGYSVVGCRVLGTTVLLQSTF